MIQEITIYAGSLAMDGFLIREANPRLALCQDRISVIDEDNHIDPVKTVDLLTLFNQ